MICSPFTVVHPFTRGTRFVLVSQRGTGVIAQTSRIEDMSEQGEHGEQIAMASRPGEVASLA